MYLSVFLLQFGNPRSSENENEEPLSEMGVDMTRDSLKEDDDFLKHQSEFSVVEEEVYYGDDESNGSLPNLAGPWHKMPLMGQMDEPDPITEQIFKKLYGDIPRKERFCVIWLAVSL